METEQKKKKKRGARLGSKKRRTSEPGNGNNERGKVVLWLYLRRMEKGRSDKANFRSRR